MKKHKKKDKRGVIKQGETKVDNIPKDSTIEVRRPPKLPSWDSLTEAVDLPAGLGEIAVALQTGRPEMIRFYKPTEPLTPEQGKALANLIRVLINTNQALQQHYSDLSVYVDQLQDNIKGVHRKMAGLTEMVNFRDPGRDGEADTDDDD